MALTQYPSHLYVKTFDTSETVKLGSFQVAAATELKYLVLWIYKHGTAGGSEQMRVKLYSSENQQAALYTSDWSALASISGISTYWLGWLRFTFDRANLSANLRYYFAVETTGYTRNEDTYYLSAVLDWPEAVNTWNTSGGYPGAKISIVGYK